MNEHLNKIQLSAEDIAEILFLEPEEVIADMYKLEKSAVPDAKGNPVFDFDSIKAIIRDNVGILVSEDHCHRIATSNNKGGVGKTVSTFNSAVTLATLGVATLIVDTDSQCNLTSMFTDREDLPSLREVALGEVSIEDALIQVDDLLYLLPSNIYIDRLKDELNSATNNDANECFDRLLNEIKRLESSFNVIMIDTGPNLDRLNLKIFELSDLVFCPVELDTFTLKGVKRVFSEVKESMSVSGKKWDYSRFRLFFNKVQRRKTQSSLRDQILIQYEDVRLNTSIPLCAAIENMKEQKLPAWADRSTKPKQNKNLKLLLPIAIREEKEGEMRKATSYYFDLALELIEFCEKNKETYHTSYAEIAKNDYSNLMD